VSAGARQAWTDAISRALSGETSGLECPNCSNPTLDAQSIEVAGGRDGLRLRCGSCGAQCVATKGTASAPAEAVRTFEDLVADALDSLPEELAMRMENVEFVVEDEPPPEMLARLPRGTTLLGLYHGIPLTRRGLYGSALPDKISIYRGPITRIARTPDGIKQQVRKTVIHEIAHHFGISDERLHELGW
jgi:predicted Zn-dependent protease with MMP-like domain